MSGVKETAAGGIGGLALALTGACVQGAMWALRERSLVTLEPTPCNQDTRESRFLFGPLCLTVARAGLTR